MTVGTSLLTSFLLDRLMKLNEKENKKKEIEPKEIILKTLPHLKNIDKIYAPGLLIDFTINRYKNYYMLFLFLFINILKFYIGYERSKISKEIKNAPNV